MSVTLASLRKLAPRPVRYLAVGALGVPIDLAVTLVATGALGLLPAQAAGWFVAASTNYGLNASVTWDGEATVAEWAAYLGVDVGRLGVRVVVVAAVAGALDHDVVATVAGIGAAAALGWVGFDRLVFD